MAGNTEIIDTVVDPSVSKQIDTLKSGLVDLDAIFIETAKSANTLNTAILNTKSYKDYTKAVGDAAIANEKLKTAQQNTVKATAQAEKSQLALLTAQDRAAKAAERAAEAARKALSPYQKLSKELDKQRAAAKDLAVQYGLQSPQFRQAAKGVQEMDKQLKAIDQTLGQSQRNVGNYKNAFSEAISEYIPFLGGTIKIRENLKTLGENLGTTEEHLGSLGAGFAEFGIGAFAVNIGLAINYLSQFQGYANKVNVFLAGLKGRANALGQQVVENAQASDGVGKKLKDFADRSVNAGLLGLIVQKFKDMTQGAADAAEKIEKLNIELKNQEDISDTLNARDKAQAENLRTLAGDKLIDYQTKKKYLDDAEELEKKALERTKEDSKTRIEIGVSQANALNQLTKKERDRLREGDIALANELYNSTNPKRQITKDAYESLVRGYAKQTEAEEAYTQNMLKIRTDRDNLEARVDKSRAQAQERLDKARIQSALDTAKQTLEDENKGYEDKVRANKEYVDKSIALIELQKQHELDSAGVPSRGGKDTVTEATNRKAIEVETQAAITKVRNEGAANLRKIIKDNNALYAKDAEEQLKRQIGLEKQLEDDFVNAQNKKLQDIEFFKAQQVNALVTQYTNGKVSEQAFNQQLFEIDAQASADRIQLQIDTLKKIAEAQASALALGFGDPKEIQATGEKINSLIIQQDDLKTQKLIKNAQELNQQRKEVHDKEKELADDAATFINTLVDASFENQLSHIKDLETAVDDQAKTEKDAVNGSVQSQAEKARKNNIIDAQAAQQKAKLEEQARKTQQKQAEFDRLFAEAKIIQNTAIGVTSALAEFPPNIPLAVLVGAIGAVQLATMLAQPLPKFEKGGTTAGGLILWGEKGVERAEEPGGRVSFSPPTATIANFPAGTKITSNYDLTSSMIRPDKLSYHIENSNNQKLDLLISETRKNRPAPQKAPKANGWMRETAKADSWAQYSNRYFR
jgi:hypothetical protein